MTDDREQPHSPGEPATPKRRRRGGVRHRKQRDASLPPGHAPKEREALRPSARRRGPMTSTRAPEYLVIGHICADIQADGTASLGGTALYSALTAANLGCSVGVITRGRYGTEVDGIQIPGLEQFADRMQIIVQDADGPTFFVNEYQGGRRTQMVRRWAGEIDLQGLPPHWLNSKIIHLGPVAREIDQRQTTILQPEFLGATPQGWMREWPANGGRVKHVPLRIVPELLSRLDAIIVSDEEIAAAREPVEWVGERRLGVITLGDKGARIIFGGQKAELPEFPLPTVDLTGAGDVFAAAFFIKAADRNASAYDAARFANATAALSLRGHAHSTVPTMKEVEDLLATNSDITRR